MLSLSIEERRRLLLAATPESRLAREFPTALRVGRERIGKLADRMSRLLETDSDIQDKAIDAVSSIIPLIKPAGDACNLNCRYCYVRENSKGVQLMGLDLLETIMRQTLGQAPDRTRIIFHGGEPLLAGIDFFTAALRFEKQYARTGQHVGNSVQTNATLIDGEWARFFADHQFSVGVSLDGPPAAHDACRRDRHGRGTYARVMDAIAMLRQAGGSPRAIAVVPPKPTVSPSELWDFMQTSGIPGWRVNPCRDTAAIATFPAYISELFNLWMATPDACGVTLFEEVIDGCLGYPVKTCWMSGCCLNLVGFDPDGSVSACCEMPVQDAYVFGNLLDQPLADLLKGAVAQRIQREVQAGRDACHGCKWQGMCHGCTFMRIRGSGSAAGPDPLCALYKDTFSRFTSGFDAAITACN